MESIEKWENDINHSETIKIRKKEVFFNYKVRIAKVE